MPTIGLLHSGRRQVFGGLVDDLVNELPTGVVLPDTPQARIYAADLPVPPGGNLYTNIDRSAAALAAAAGTTFDLLVAAGGPQPAIALRDALAHLGKNTFPVVFTT